MKHDELPAASINDHPPAATTRPMGQPPRLAGKGTGDPAGPTWSRGHRSDRHASKAGAVRLALPSHAPLRPAPALLEPRPRRSAWMEAYLFQPSFHRRPSMQTSVATTQDESLAHLFRTLGSPLRVAMLRKLVTPTAVGDIVIASEPKEAHDTVKPISRQAVRHHLEKLIEARLVVPVEAPGRAQRYVSNPLIVFLLSESISEFLAARPTADAGEVTQIGPPAAEKRGARTSSVVMVKGPDEGRRHGLMPRAGGDQRWLIGRGAGVEIQIDYDGHVSHEHASITWADDQFYIQDMPHSRNGTYVNFARIGGEPHALRNGDLITVGRTNVLFQE